LTAFWVSVWIFTKETKWSKIRRTVWKFTFFPFSSHTFCLLYVDRGNVHKIVRHIYFRGKILVFFFLQPVGLIEFFCFLFVIRALLSLWALLIFGVSLMRRFAKGEKVFVKEKMLRIFFSKFDCLFLPVEKLLTCLAFRSLKKDKNIFEGKDFSPLRFFLVWSLMRDFLINII